MRHTALLLASALLLPAAAPAQSDGAERVRFLPAERCAACHSNAPAARAMRDEQGARIAPVNLWQSSMMANAARDPLWRAVVSAEVAAQPQHREEIQAKCARCHAPMAATASLDLALDGVSCTVCHQIAPAGLGEEASFSGGFRFTTDGRLYGPHASPFSMPMRRHTGFAPAQGEQVSTSAMCATCHTLFTESFDAAGALTGQVLPEQTPYLEWRNSVFNDEAPAPGPRAASCQACHLPTRSEAGLPVTTRIARNPGGRDWGPIRARQPFGRHVFVGANALLPGIFREHGEELGAEASPEQFDETLRLVHAARPRSARLQIVPGAQADGRLAFAVEIENLAGHKLPTAHPSRRAWLRVRVLDAGGAVLWQSGQVDAEGRLLGRDGRPLASELAGGPVAGFPQVVRQAGQVPVFEAVMADSEGQPTWLLLRGSTYLKDTRILPAGWDPQHADARATRPAGVRLGEDFRGALARVRYDIAGAAPGPLRIEAELVHQVLGTRYGAELFEFETPEVRAFEALYAEAGHRWEVVARASLAVAAGP